MNAAASVTTSPTTTVSGVMLRLLSTAGLTRREFMLRRSGAVALIYALVALSGVHASESIPASERLRSDCLACHGDSATMQDRVAPPMVAVRDHYLSAFPERADFIDAVVSWVGHPTVERSQMPGAIRRFGLMPPLSIDTKALEAIAALIHDTALPQPHWYEEHRIGEHGPRKGVRNR